MFSLILSQILSSLYGINEWAVKFVIYPRVLITKDHKMSTQAVFCYPWQFLKNPSNLLFYWQIKSINQHVTQKKVAFRFTRNWERNDLWDRKVFAGRWGNRVFESLGLEPTPPVVFEVPLTVNSAALVLRLAIQPVCSECPRFSEQLNWNAFGFEVGNASLEIQTSNLQWNAPSFFSKCLSSV